MFHTYCEGYGQISIFFFSLWKRQNAEVLIRFSKLQYVSILVETFKNELKLMWRN